MKIIKKSNEKSLNHTITKGIVFLAQDQASDGSFPCLVSEHIDQYDEHTAQVPTIVPTNIVLSSFAHFPQTEIVHNICKKSAEFLLQEKSAYWSFNYWFRNSDSYITEPYPDDTDDTFCALAALYEYDPQIFDGEVMAKITIMLTSAEKGEGGPYDMWLVPLGDRRKWNDTDLVVNSNIAFFLHLQGIYLPNVTKLIEQKIENHEYEFPYNKIYPSIYFISRFYRGDKTAEMIELLLSKQEEDGKWENPLRTALAVSALLNLSQGSLVSKLAESIVYLQRTQLGNGSWKAHSFYYQMKTKDRSLFAGSESITTALCLEALSAYQRAVVIEHDTSSKKLDLSADVSAIIISSKEIKTQIIQKIEERFTWCDPDLRREGLKFISHIIDSDTDEIVTLMPYLFLKNLKEEYRLSLDMSDTLAMLVELGSAHVYGWTAYTIYDDFLDGEGKSVLLSVANACLRESYAIFSVYAEKHNGSKVVAEIFDTIDGANIWESIYCCMACFDKEGDLPAFGNFEKLADKSLGHALSTLMLLLTVGVAEDSSDFCAAVSFFKHYIIARQLNDDAHDWQEDMQQSRITPVVVRILEKSRNHREISSLQQLFWKEIIVDVCGDILHHIELAEGHLMHVSILVDTQEIIRALLLPIQNSVDKALHERQITMMFLETYITAKVSS